MEKHGFGAEDSIVPLFAAASPDRQQPHIQMLQEEFRRRHRRNPRYSLRAYAKSLGLHPSALSRIFAGKQSLSIEACSCVLKTLPLDPPAIRSFLKSLVDEKTRHMQERLERNMGVSFAATDVPRSDADREPATRILLQ